HPHADPRRRGDRHHLAVLPRARTSAPVPRDAAPAAGVRHRPIGGPGVPVALRDARSRGFPRAAGGGRALPRHGVASGAWRARRRSVLAGGDLARHLRALRKGTGVSLAGDGGQPSSRADRDRRGPPGRAGQFRRGALNLCDPASPVEGETMRITEVRAIEVAVPWQAPLRFAYGVHLAATRTLVMMHTD